MGNCASVQYNRLLGTDLAGASLAVVDGNMVDFMVPAKKPLHYMQHCNEVICAADPVGIINQYTGG
jgi:hypothetical protein